MTTSSISHGEFTIEREYDAPPERVFAAWANEEAKNEWFGARDTEFLSQTNEYSLDFRVGGVEVLDGVTPRGQAFAYRATFGDIVENKRIVMTYDVLVNGKRISVSLMTAEFFATASGTKLVTTEQGAFLDGYDTNEDRIEGAEHSMDMLDRFMAAQRATVQ
jgi:uncharacterized protein YndB with AHSA1/START domain